MVKEKFYKKFCVVIPTRGRWIALHNLVDSIRMQFLYEQVISNIFVIVDFGLDYPYYFPSFSLEGVTFLLSPYRGVSAARNLGLKMVSSEYCIFLDDDVVLPDEFWLHRVIKCIDQYSDAVGWGGSYILPVHSRVIERFQIIAERGFFVNGWQKNSVNYHLLGGNCIYKRDIIVERFGGFDENIYKGAEELELHERLRRGGLRIIGSFSLDVIHNPKDRNLFKLIKREWQHGKGKAYSLIKNKVPKSTFLYLFKGKYLGNTIRIGFSIFKGTDRIVAFVFFALMGVIYWMSLIFHAFVVNIHRRDGNITYKHSLYPYFSIIIPVYNSLQFIKKSIDAVKEQLYPHEKLQLIIVDDGSTDGTKEYLNNLTHQNYLGFMVKVYSLKVNMGRSVARNIGLALADGEIVAFLDADCTVDHDWILRMALIFTMYKNIDAVGGSIIDVSKDKMAQVSYILNFSKWLPTGRKRLVSDVPLCNIAYRKESVKNIKFIQGSKDAYYKDSLFNYEFIRRGGKIMFDPQIKAYHHKWEGGIDRESLKDEQQRYARGFIEGGFKVHGIYGNMLVKYRWLNVLTVGVRIILIFIRCLSSLCYLKKFIILFPYILKWEFFRNKTIFQLLKVNKLKNI